MQCMNKIITTELIRYLSETNNINYYETDNISQVIKYALHYKFIRSQEYLKFNLKFPQSKYSILNDSWKKDTYEYVLQVGTISLHWITSPFKVHYNVFIFHNQKQFTKDYHRHV